jgi:hypothetical protein
MSVRRWSSRPQPLTYCAEMYISVLRLQYGLFISCLIHLSIGRPPVSYSDSLAHPYRHNEEENMRVKMGSFCLAAWYQVTAWASGV